MISFFEISLVILSIFISFSNAATNNTTCADHGLDWYTNATGETPCTTYQRLRQICNSNYQVGAMNPNTPPDFCDEQVADCCCNSISFALSMLCLNCQQGLGSSGNGIDAGDGAYQDYLGTGSHCSTSLAKNQSFPTNIQSAVCNIKLDVFDDLYSLFWGVGSWFYIVTSETLTTAINSKNGNTFTHCQSTTVTSSSASKGSSSTSSSSSPTNTSSQSASNGNVLSSSSSLGSGAIAGIAVGAVVAVVGVCVVAWLLWRRRRQKTVRRFTGQVVLEGDPFLDHTRPQEGHTDTAPPPVPYSYGTPTHQSNVSIPGPIPGATSFSNEHSTAASQSTGTQNVSSTHNTNTSIRAGSNASRGNSTRKRALPNPVPSSSGTTSGSIATSVDAERSPPPSSPPMRERDAGPVPISMFSLEDDSLPPAYGEQVG